MIKFYFELIWGSIRAVVGGGWRPLGTLAGGGVGICPGEMRGAVVAVLSLLVLTGSVASIVSTVRGPRVPVDCAPYASLGEAAAEETARLLHDRGQVVVWMFEMGRAHPENDCVLKQFRRSLRAHAQIRVVGVERLRPQAESMNARSFFATGQFWQLLDKHRQADAIVSFAGMPALTGDDLERLGTPRPHIISVPYLFEAINLRTLMENDVVQVAIVPRSSPPGKQSEPASSREWFDRYYQVVKRERDVDR